jgi:hypothetical protein
MDFIDQNIQTDNIFLEESPNKTQISLICLRYGLDYVKVRENPDTITPEMRREQMEWLARARCKWIKKPKNSKTLNKEQILQRLKWDVVQKVPIIYLDHLTWLLYDDNSLKGIDTLLREMADIMEGSDSHLWVVCHVNRSSRANKHFLKEEDYPFWDKLDKTSARGSGSIEQVAWNMIVAECLVLNEDWELGRRRLRVVKNREGRSTGVCDEFAMNMQTGKYTVY